MTTTAVPTSRTVTLRELSSWARFDTASLVQLRTKHRLLAKQVKGTDVDSYLFHQARVHALCGMLANRGHVAA